MNLKKQLYRLKDTEQSLVAALLCFLLPHRWEYFPEEDRAYCGRCCKRDDE